MYRYAEMNPPPSKGFENEELQNLKIQSVMYMLAAKYMLPLPALQIENVLMQLQGMETGEVKKLWMV